MALSSLLLSSEDAHRAFSDTENLVFFGAADFQQELNQYPGCKDGAEWQDSTRVLLSEFNHAVDLWELRAYENARQKLVDIDEGQTNFGPLKRIQSSVVKNNLGCVEFRLQGNRGFVAYEYLRAAINLARGNNNLKSKIESNLHKLDEMVN
jgi:hypothetical protein